MSEKIEFEEVSWSELAENEIDLYIGESGSKKVCLPIGYLKALLTRSAVKVVEHDDCIWLRLPKVKEMKKSKVKAIPLYGKNGPDVRIRRVRVLQGRLREQADKRGLKSDDLVLVKTTIKPHQPPIYELEKVEGDPVSFLLKRAGRGGLK